MRVLGKICDGRWHWRLLRVLVAELEQRCDCFLRRRIKGDLSSVQLRIRGVTTISGSLRFSSASYVIV